MGPHRLSKVSNFTNPRPIFPKLFFYFHKKNDEGNCNLNGKTKKYKVTSRRVLEKRVLFISCCYWRSSLTKTKRKAFL